MLVGSLCLLGPRKVPIGAHALRRPCFREFEEEHLFSYKNYVRMLPNNFYLCRLIAPRVKKQEMHLRRRISMGERLAITLPFSAFDARSLNSFKFVLYKGGFTCHKSAHSFPPSQLLQWALTFWISCDRRIGFVVRCRREHIRGDWKPMSHFSDYLPRHLQPLQLPIPKRTCC